MNRAYSILTVKAVEEDQRVIRGTATTPSPDRVGDIVEPLGVKFNNPMPLLWQHKHDKPVGTVTFDKPTKDGITFEAKLAKIDEPGTLKERTDEAWQSVKAGLVSAVSIGFRALEYTFIENTGGIRFTESEVMELSLVTIPANADATISQIKSIDTEIRAATGIKDGEGRPVPPGVTGTPKVKANKPTPKEGTKMKTIAEQISAFEATRLSKAADLETLMTGSEGETLDADKAEAADTLTAEIKSIDDHLKRLRIVEGLKASTAKAVAGVVDAKTGSDARDARIQVKAQQKSDPGIEFARLAKVKALAFLSQGEHRQVDVAKALYGENSLVYGIVSKANVVAGASVSGNWAENLVGDETSVYADFAEFLRPMTIVGKFGQGGIPNLRLVPFRTPLIGQTGGGQAYWVGEGKPKPLTAFDFNRTTLDELKVATISVVTEELLRKSSPSADAILRDALAAAVAERIDIDFIDPDKAASAGVSPASITNGVAAIASSGNDADAIREDIRALMAMFVAANNPPTSAVFIMSSANALAVSLMRNPLGQQEFPGITMNGGTLEGIPVIVSEYFAPVTAGGFVALVNASDIYFADEGGVMVDVSREASLQMLDNPTNDVVTPTATSMVSMWQTNSVAFRAERILNWAKRRTSAVALLDEVNWGMPGS
ncbi:phage major capsid protein [Aminobacter sp. SR38]|jgi:HK97 family phage prohead protease|uniref:phage major capsid protein n=1 Tax=Aminobacter sp. SR38 TaxID=2774562 RepID=UPI0017853677|nr:phage major capsid protein [Aminobacter sp. SR38]QOF71464.1 phage major capsid protein [Aminobacter sp. SR38]